MKIIAATALALTLLSSSITTSIAQIMPYGQGAMPYGQGAMPYGQGPMPYNQGYRPYR